MSPLSLVLSSHFQTYIALVFLTRAPFHPPVLSQSLPRFNSPLSWPSENNSRLPPGFLPLLLRGLISPLFVCSSLLGFFFFFPPYPLFKIGGKDQYYPPSVFDKIMLGEHGGDGFVVTAEREEMGGRSGCRGRAGPWQSGSGWTSLDKYMQFFR